MTGFPKALSGVDRPKTQLKDLSLHSDTEKDLG
jgi:hypothetical protein